MNPGRQIHNLSATALSLRINISFYTDFEEILAVTPWTFILLMPVQRQPPDVKISDCSDIITCSFW